MIRDKDIAFMIIAAVIILATVIMSIADERRHEIRFKQLMEFQKDTEAFKNKGGRNTAHMGLMLCERINTLEIHKGLEPVKCGEIYR